MVFLCWKLSTSISCTDYSLKRRLYPVISLGFFKMLKLNFSHPNPILTRMGFTDHQLHVDLTDPTLLEKLRNYLFPIVGDGSEEVTIVPPGLAPLSVLVVVTIHGLTGYFPKVISMVKKEGGFEPLLPTDLQEYRNSCVRMSRENLKIL